MKQLVGTYGKTWHTWHTDREKSLPLGMPQLMMGFTADGQVDAALVEQRDQRLQIRSTKKREERDGIAAPPIDPGADAWQRGQVIQLPDGGGMSHAASGPGTECVIGGSAHTVKAGMLSAERMQRQSMSSPEWWGTNQPAGKAKIWGC